MKKLLSEEVWEFALGGIGPAREIRPGGAEAARIVDTFPRGRWLVTPYVPTLRERIKILFGQKIIVTTIGRMPPVYVQVGES